MSRFYKGDKRQTVDAHQTSAEASAAAAKESEDNAAQSKDDAADSAARALSEANRSEVNAGIAAQTEQYRDDAQGFALSATSSANAAGESETKAKASETSSASSAEAAYSHRLQAADHASAAGTSETNAGNSATEAQLAQAAAQAARDAAQESESGAASTVALASNLTGFSFAGSGFIDRAEFDDFYTTLLVPNQIQLAASNVHIDGKIFSIGQTTLTLPEVPNSELAPLRQDLLLVESNGSTASYVAIGGVDEGGEDFEQTLASNGYLKDAGRKGIWTKGGKDYLPVAPIQRYNLGAYSGEHNQAGCGYKGSPGWPNNNRPASQADCFSGQTGGAIGQISGHPSGRFYDQILPEDIDDRWRMSANKPDYQRVLSKAVGDAIGGVARGWESLLFTTFKSLNTGYFIAQNSSHILVQDAPSGGAVLDMHGSGLPANAACMVWQPSIGAVCYGSISTSNSYIRLARHRSNLGQQHHETDNGLAIDGSPIYFALVSEIPIYSAELDWTDIIGYPSNIAAASAFPNGVAGQWIPVIPDGTSKSFPLNRKSLDSSVALLYSSNIGASWSSTTKGLSTTTNESLDAVAATNINFYHYTTPAHPTKPGSNSKVLALGDVTAFNAATLNRPVLASSLIDKVIKGTTNPVQLEGFAVSGFVVLPDAIGADAGKIYSSSGYRPEHSPIVLADSNNSPAVKVMSSLVGIDGILHLQLHGRELQYNGDWGDDNSIPIGDNDYTVTDDNGQTVRAFCHHIPLNRFVCED